MGLNLQLVTEPFTPSFMFFYGSLINVVYIMRKSISLYYENAHYLSMEYGLMHFHPTWFKLGEPSDEKER